MRPRLNLATAPLENQRRFLAAALAVGLPALVLFVVLGARVVAEWRATGERRAEISRLEGDIQRYKQQRSELVQFFESPDTRRVMERAAFLNGMIDQRSFPWTKIFLDLERELPIGVRIVSLAPHLISGHVELKMVVGAQSDKGKLEFLKTLESSPEFSKLLVVSEQHPTRSEEGDQVLLELVAQYKTEKQ
jgi:Tfp pilus assembly protein PilN